MNATPRLGELFTYFPHPEKRSLWIDDANQIPKLVQRDAPSDVGMNVAAGHGTITYNSHGWHDPDGHFYYLDSGQPSVTPQEPFFFRARQGDVLNLTFTNKIGFRKPQGPVCAADGSPVPQPALGQLERMYFDQNIPPSDNIVVGGRTPAECGLHVHLVKFDPICADGGEEPGGWGQTLYIRLHGSPTMYHSSYGEEYLDRVADRMTAAARHADAVWCIFDNTARGAATVNALGLLARLSS